MSDETAIDTEVGYVTGVREFLITVSGLPGAKLREMVKFKTGILGQVFTILEDSIEILLVDKGEVQIGETVQRLNREISVLLPKKLTGLRIDVLGISSRTSYYKPVITAPTGISERRSIKKNFETGVAIVDIITPLASGQRELILGDRKTGKTQFLLQVLKFQALSGVACVYAAIGKKEVEILELIEFVNASGIAENVTIVASSIGDGVGKIFLNPYTAMTIAEELRNEGRDVLLILDDLTTHAQFYREISLIAKRFPGRSAYPGNIFHIHSQLMERAGNFSVQGKDVAITCLPVVQSTLGDIANYITTNLMSMTDGHIYLDTEIFDEGRRPAVNPFLSVTRVGHQTQSALVRDISREVLSFLIVYNQAQGYSHFGSEASENTKLTLLKGKLLYTIFDQIQGSVVPVNLGAFLIAHLWAGSFRGFSIETMKNEVQTLVARYGSDSSFKDLVIKLLEKNKTFKSLVSEVNDIPLGK